MSIEAMKRIKSLLQDGDKIDSHTISAVVAECDAAILTQQPAAPEPVAGEWYCGNCRVPVPSPASRPAPSAAADVVRDAAQEAVEELHKLNEYAIVYINDPEWARVSDTCQKLIGSIDAAMLAAK